LVVADAVRAANGREMARSDPISSNLLPASRTRMHPNPFCSVTQTSGSVATALQS
jgi:hypothetical protein